jgi:hypothetical protein
MGPRRSRVSLPRSPADPRKEDADLAEIAAAAEQAIHTSAPHLRRVTKYGAPTYQGQGDVCTIGVGKDFVAVGFWAGAKLAASHPILEGSAPSSRVVKLRSVGAAMSPESASLVRAAC